LSNARATHHVENAAGELNARCGAFCVKHKAAELNVDATLCVKHTEAELNARYKGIRVENRAAESNAGCDAFCVKQTQKAASNAR